MHSELSYGLSFAPKLQRVGGIHISGSDQPTPDPSFSLLLLREAARSAATRHWRQVQVAGAASVGSAVAT